MVPIIMITGKPDIFLICNQESLVFVGVGIIEDSRTINTLVCDN